MPTKIEWCDETWNSVIGCTKVSTGCKNCFAIGWAHRHANNPRFGTHFQGYNPNPYMGLATPDGKNWTNEVRCLDERLEIPLKWKKPRRIFLSSMGDVFHKDVPDEFLHKLFAVMSFCPQHQFMILTKRAERMREYLSRITTQQAVLFETERWIHEPIEQWPLTNVALGVSVSNQPEADAAIPELLQTPAAMRFVSAEPLLSGIKFKPEWLWGVNHIPAGQVDQGFFLPPLNLIIAGGETGSGARPSNPKWFRDLRYQCAEAGVPFHFKRWGEWLDITQISLTSKLKESLLHTFPDGRRVYRAGKKAAGRLLDGIEHNGMMDHTKKWDEQ